MAAPLVACERPWLADAPLPEAPVPETPSLPVDEIAADPDSTSALIQTFSTF